MSSERAAYRSSSAATVSERPCPSVILATVEQLMKDGGQVLTHRGGAFLFARSGREPAVWPLLRTHTGVVRRDKDEKVLVIGDLARIVEAAERLVLGRVVVVVA